MGTLDAFLTNRLGAVFATDTCRPLRAPSSRRSARSAGTPGCASSLGFPGRAARVRDTAGALGTLRHESWPVELPSADRSWISRRRSPARLRRARPRQGDLRHRRLRLRARRRPAAETGRRPAAHGCLEHRWSRVRAPPASSRRGRCSSGWQPAWDRGGSAGGQHARARCRELGRCEGAARPCRDRCALVAPQCPGRPPGLNGGTTRENIARAALEGISWRVADVVAAMKETSPVETLRVDGGLTNEPLLLEMQADRSECRSRPRAPTPRSTGAAALGGVGRVIGSLTDLPEMLPADRRVDPKHDESGAPSSTSTGASSSRPPRPSIRTSRT